MQLGCQLVTEYSDVGHIFENLAPVVQKHCLGQQTVGAHRAVGVNNDFNTAVAGSFEGGHGGFGQNYVGILDDYFALRGVDHRNQIVGDIISWTVNRMFVENSGRISALAFKESERCKVLHAFVLCNFIIIFFQKFVGFF